MTADRFAGDGAGDGRPRAVRPAVSMVSIVVVSKDEPALATTLSALVHQVADVAPTLVPAVELVVVDASRAPLDPGLRPPGVIWVPFEPPPGVGVSIAHQRNAGVRAAHGDVVVFTDCGCIPQRGWLAAVLGPIVGGGELLACGVTGALGELDPYASARAHQTGTTYLSEAATINLAVHRRVLDEVGEFDESFAYGSDIDLTWRAVHSGFRIRLVPDAVVLHDWGSRRRQLRRSFRYGEARARLYAKHVLGNGPQSVRRRRPDAGDAVPLLYAAYLVGLPLARRRPAYLLLPLATAWRARRAAPVATVIDHLAYGAGLLAGLGRLAARRSP